MRNLFVMFVTAVCFLLLLKKNGIFQVEPLKERNISNKHKKFKNPNWWGTEQLDIYKHDRGVELGSTDRQLQLSGQSGT